MKKYLISYNEFNSFKEECFLVVDNSVPPKHKYLANVLKYLDYKGINYKVVETLEELSHVLNKCKVIGAISTGSDYRVDDIETNQLSFEALRNLDCPIYGICYGFQSMAKYYGSKIGSGDEVCGNLKVTNFDKEEELYKYADLDNLKLSFCFHDYPLQVPNGFKIISELDGKICGISNGKNRFGTLFHPENFVETFPVLDNFIQICKNY